MSTDGDELGKWLETASHTIDQGKALAWLRERARHLWNVRRSDLRVSSVDLYKLLSEVLPFDSEVGCLWYEYEAPGPEGPGDGNCWALVITQTRPQTRGLPW